MTTLPPTERHYLDDTYAFSATSTVLAVQPKEGGNENDKSTLSVVLSQTLFHPQGGGQPADFGRIVSADGGVVFAVDSVRSGDGGVVHHYGTFADPSTMFEAGAAVTLHVDEARRRLHARLHSAGHALDVAVLQLQLGLRPTKGHHFEDAPFVEYYGKLPPEAGTAEEVVAALNVKMRALVEEGVPTEVQTTSKAEAATLLAGGEHDVAHFAEDAPVRLVSVGGNLCPCGGTHVQDTKELGVVEVTKVKTKKNVTKISYRLLSSGDEEAGAERRRDE